jgi:hypothetical protein
MKLLGIAIALATLTGCFLQVTQGTDESSYRPTTSGAGSGGASSGGAGGGNSTGGISGGATSGGAGSIAGASTGGSPTGGFSNGSTTGAGTTTGGCDGGCQAGMVCVGSACVCPGNEMLCTTTSPTMGTSSSCVDTSSDPKNCGSCGFTCTGPGAGCSNGACTCAKGSDFTPCASGTGAVCTDEYADTSNCGSCGNACTMPAVDCILGNCTCADEKTLCGGADSGVAPFCANTVQDPDNCGSCGYVCDDSYAAGSGCRFGLCFCDPFQSLFCANLPATSPPTCSCNTVDAGCATPSFATDVYPLLAQQSGDFGCAASGCHSGGAPAGGLAFLDDAGQQDAGMAYAALVGIDGGGGSDDAPGCDAGIPPGAPSTQCACVSRVVPGNIYESYLIDTVVNDLPGQCATSHPMPIVANDAWSPLGGCEQQLLQQWVSAGANP